MTDDHFEPRADFPTAMLVGALLLSLVIVAVLSVFVFGMGGHGTTTQPANSPTQQRR